MFAEYYTSDVFCFNVFFANKDLYACFTVKCILPQMRLKARPAGELTTFPDAPIIEIKGERIAKY